MTNYWDGKVALICSDCRPNYTAFASVEELKAHRSLFHPSFAEQYELVLKQSKERFGSECQHERVRNGICSNCFRKVVAR